MKKTLTKLLSMMLVFASFCGMSVTASAATLEMSDTGIWWERAAADGSNHKSWHLFDYYIDGDVAYCIEPGTEEGNPIYETSWEGVGLPNSIKERMQLIGYYGYTYPGHGTAGYRAATSAMLWKEIMGPGSWVTFNTARYSAGANYDCSGEEAEINRLVSRHYVKPSFNGGVFNIQVGQPYQLNDTNGVLGDYNVSVNNAEYSVNGNTLNIKTTDSGTLDMSLSKKMYYSHGFRFFAGDTKQNMMIPGTVDPVLAAARIKSYYSTIEIVKSDSEIGTAQGQATLQGAVYGVYNKATNELITKITTDETGYGKSEAIFPYGEYYVRELSASEGYYVDETVYDVDLRGVENVKVDVTEEIVKNKHIGSYWTLLAEIPNDEYAGFLIDDLKDPAEFGTDNPFPCVPVSNPIFSEEGNGYKGGVVPFYTYMVIKGLNKYDSFIFARECAIRHMYFILDTLHPDGETVGDVWESYKPNKEGAAISLDGDFVNQKRNLAMISLITITLMIENIIGLEISLPRKTVDWTMTSLESMGIEKLSLKRNNITILSNKNSRGWEIRLESEKLYYFTIMILDENKKKTLPIPSGKCSMLIDKL